MDRDGHPKLGLPCHRVSCPQTVSAGHGTTRLVGQALAGSTGGVDSRPSVPDDRRAGIAAGRRPGGGLGRDEVPASRDKTPFTNQ